MKIIAINGSPRKNNNTAILLKNTLEGAMSKGFETETINLYDLNYKGCKSCFACKLKNSKLQGKCAMNDELSEVLEEILNADALVLGSPIYFESTTGEMRSFLERLLFPILTYTDGYVGCLDKKIPTGFIYSMNVPKGYMIEADYLKVLKPTENDIERLLGYCETLLVNDTLQFDDYSKYVVTVFDEEKKKEVNNKQFPIDCKNAFQLGINLVNEVNKSKI